LPGKKQLLDREAVAKGIVIDATETPIERPKKGQSSFLQWEEEATYPGGGASPAPLKTQLVVDPQTKAVIYTTFAAGKEHDFHLFKRSKVKLKPETKCLANRSYQGIQKLHVLQRFSIGWSIATAVSEPANNILGGHCSKSIRNRLV